MAICGSVIYNMLLIGHGAEAKIYLQEVDGVKTVIKERLPKTYRHPELDRRINETRIRAVCVQ